MFGSEVLEIATGLAVTYALLALLCTAIIESVSRWFGLRSRTLEKGIRNLLDDPQGTGLARTFYAHPLIRGLGFKREREGFMRKSGKPSYIQSRQFSTVLLDSLFPPDSTGPRTLQEIRDAAAAVPSGEVRRELLSLIDSADGDVAQVRRNIEEWFDAAMDRVSGWYKRNAQLIALVTAAVVTFVFNADTVAIADRLARDQAMRDAVVATAQSLNFEDFADQDVMAQTLNRQINDLGIPFGWFRDGTFAPYSEGQHWYGKAIGLFITAVAVSLGAPFWFDMLGRIANLRASGRPPQRTGEGS